MTTADQRRLTWAANRLLNTAGYSADGTRHTPLERVKIKPATPIDFPEGLSKSQRKAYRKQVMLARGEAILVQGQLVTAVEQKSRLSRQRAPQKRKERLKATQAWQAARHLERLAREREQAAATVTTAPKKRVVKKALIP